MTPPPTKPNSVRVIVTYAGFVNESNLLEEIYHTVVQPKNKIDLGSFPNTVTGEKTWLPVYVKGDTICLWDHEPRMPWQTKSYYFSERNQPGFRESAFRRLHQNQWTLSSNPLDMSQWDSCVDLGIEKNYHEPPVSDQNLQLAIGIDASYAKDRTAVVSVFKKNGLIWLGPRKWWQPSPNEPLNFEHTIEAYIKELAAKFFISVCFYDPYMMIATAQKLQSQGITMTPWPQTQPNTIKMTELLLDKLRQKEFVMYPDSELRKEACMVELKECQEKGRRIIKDHGNKKIDSIIALSMAVLAGELHLPDFDSIGDQIMMLQPRRTVQERWAAGEEEVSWRGGGPVSNMRPII